MTIAPYNLQLGFPFAQRLGGYFGEGASPETWADPTWNAFFVQLQSAGMRLRIALSPATVTANSVDVLQTAPTSLGYDYVTVAVYKFTGGMDAYANAFCTFLENPILGMQDAIPFVKQLGQFSGPVRLKVDITE